MEIPKADLPVPKGVNARTKGVKGRAYCTRTPALLVALCCLAWNLPKRPENPESLVCIVRDPCTPPRHPVPVPPYAPLLPLYSTPIAPVYPRTPFYCLFTIHQQPRTPVPLYPGTPVPLKSPVPPYPAPPVPPVPPYPVPPYPRTPVPPYTEAWLWLL